MTESMVFSPVSLEADIFCVPSKGNLIPLSSLGSYQPHLLADNPLANTCDVLDGIIQSLHKGII